MGRVSIRLPETLHRGLTEEARMEGVSLNQYVVYLLARRREGSYPMEPLRAQEVAQRPERITALLDALGPSIGREEALDRLRELGEEAEVADQEKLAVAAARRLRQRHKE